MTGCTGRGIRWCSSHTMSGRHSAPQGGCILKTGAFLSEIIRHRITGVLEPRRRFTLSGLYSFLQRLTGVHELRQQYALSGRRVFRLNQAGTCADAARAHKRVDTYGFHPLVNHPFPLASLTHIRDRRPLRKGNGRGFFLPQGSTVCSCFATYTPCQMHYCYTCGQITAGATQGELPEGQEKVPWGITVSRNLFVRCYTRPLRI